mmetsp:Transcript_7270/g.19485  ORF Transcript_7270/g.19485 Transcript_7270/m.19485 type:complete len:302 (-) Transcript_7270:150-1055(-)
MDHSAEFVVEEEKVADATGRDGDTGAKKAEAAQVQANFQAAKAQDEKQRLAQRQKQVDFGKNTIGYQRYIQQVPKHRRRFRDPATPDIHKDVSKRSFEGQVKAWRRALHAWDQEGKAPDQREQWRAPSPGKPDDDVKGESQAMPGSRQSGSSSGGSEGTDPCSSQGSLDGYIAPKVPHGRSRKRALEEEEVLPVQAGNHQHAQKHHDSRAEAAAEGSQCEHNAKRSNKMKDNEDLPPTKPPTCFPTTPGALLGQTHLLETAKAVPQESDAPVEDNVVHMILGSENNSRSAMSWACDDQPCL